MELQTQNPQHAYNPAWGSTPLTPQNWSEGSLAKLYDQDLYAWTNHTISLLRNRQFDTLDIEHLVEEIEDMSKRDFRSLESFLNNLIMHLLKWKYQPGIQSGSWRSSISNARKSIQKVVRDSPSFVPKLAATFVGEYESAREEASYQTGLPIATFPVDCPFTLEQVLEKEWLPE
jgi:hypothetical protein